MRNRVAVFVRRPCVVTFGEGPMVAAAAAVRGRWSPLGARNRAAMARLLQMRLARKAEAVTG